MTEASEGQRSTVVEQGAARPDSAGEAGASAVGTPDRPEKATQSGPATLSSTPGSSGPSEAVLGPFTLRELVFGGGVALVFIGTLLPFIDGVVRYANFWNTAPLFFIGIGILLPVIALALLAGRRLGSSGLRVGSLSVDQFASVTAVLAATFFFLQTVTAFHAGPLLALIGSLGMVAATVAGPFLPVLKNDFSDRPEVPARVAARPITLARPRPAKPAKPAKEAKEAKPSAQVTQSSRRVTSGPVDSSDAGQPDSGGVNPAAAAVLQNGAGLYGAGGAGAVGAGAAASGQSGMERGASQETAAHDEASAVHGSEAGAHAVDETRVNQVVRDDSTRTYAAADTSPEERGRQEPITATRSAEEEPVLEAFWFAVGSPRRVFDEQTGREVFTLQPGDWEVGIEDRGNEFLVQDKRTGAVGILRDLRNIERAPRD